MMSTGSTSAPLMSRMLPKCFMRGKRVFVNAMLTLALVFTTISAGISFKSAVLDKVFPKPAQPAAVETATEEAAATENAPELPATEAEATETAPETAAE